MPKRKKKIDHPDQFSLLDLIRQGTTTDHSEGSLDIQRQLRACVSSCIKACPLSRWEIVGRMSMFLDSEISKYMLDTWTAESKEHHRFPAEYLPAFCRAVDCYDPLRLLAEKAGVFILPGPDALRSEIQKIEEHIKELQKERQRRLVILEEISNGPTDSA